MELPSGSTQLPTASTDPPGATNRWLSGHAGGRFVPGATSIVISAVFENAWPSNALNVNESSVVPAKAV
jgi:hypothetical protein